MAWNKGIAPVEEAWAVASVGFTDCKLHEWIPGNVLLACPVPDDLPETAHYDWFKIAVETPGHLRVIEFQRDTSEERLVEGIRSALKAA